MEFIDKINQVGFYPHYLNFETNKWNAVINEYGAYNYKGFSTAFKNTIKGVLIKEQNHLCCYCMKHLEVNDSSSIEHLYPNNPQPHNSFVSYGVTCIEKKLFDFTTRKVPTPLLDNLPHDISYYNLLACCKLCNNTRGTNEIRSFVFDTSVKKEFLYNDKGNVFSALYQDEIIKIGLANDYYVYYRRLWKYIAKTNTVLNFSNPNRLKDIVKRAALALHLETKSIFYADFIFNGLKVDEAIKYKYFFDN